jgi:DNA-directed RNA polymerase specialized sigma24 family protein
MTLDQLLAESDRLRRIAIAILDDEHEAEDVLQEVLIDAKPVLVDVPSIEDPAGWLTIVTKNRAIDRWRSLEAENRRAREYPTQGTHETSKSFEEIEEILAVIRFMTPKMREVFVASELLGEDVMEIQLRYDITRAEANLLIRSAKAEFRRIWEERNGS